MGLFGGFKAKFTKDSTAKTSKSAKKDDVVCLGYRVYSEFDSPPQYLQRSPETSKKPPAIKTVAPRPNTIANSEGFNAPQPSVSTQIPASPKIKKVSKKKALATEKKHVSTANVTLTNNISEEHSNTSSLNRATSASHPNIALITTESVKLRNGGVKEESRSAPNSVYTRGKTSSFNPNNTKISSSNNTESSTEVVVQEVQPKAPKSILKSKTLLYNEDLSSHNGQVSNINNNPDNAILTTNENIYSEAEYDRTLTLATSKTSKSKESTTKTVDYMSATQAVTKSSSTQVATYVHTEVSNSKTDPIVSANDNSNSYYSGGYTSFNKSTSSIGSTSNHAASIFFGGDEEPEIQRPRRANLAVVQSEEDC